MKTRNMKSDFIVRQLRWALCEIAAAKPAAHQGSRLLVVSDFYSMLINSDFGKTNRQGLHDRRSNDCDGVCEGGRRR